MTEISLDARCLLTTYFSQGVKSTVHIGGHGSINKFTDRAKAALNELMGAELVTVKLFNTFGRLEYRGTEKVSSDLKLSFGEMEIHGRWQPTERVTS